MPDAAFRPAFRPQAIKIFKLPARNNARVSFAADETERTVHTLAIAACCISTGYVYFHACLIRRRKKITGCQRMDNNPHPDTIPNENERITYSTDQTFRSSNPVC